MPYKEINDLPDTIRKHLPKHAQEIFQAAFKNAEEEHGEKERAFRVAYSAVKPDYEKSEHGNWYKNPQDISLFR